MSFKLELLLSAEGNIIPSSNSKVRMFKSHKNTFGFLPGRSYTCPGATEGTGGCLDTPNGRSTNICYVSKLLKVRPNIKRALEHNTDMLNGKSKGELTAMFYLEFRRSLDSFYTYARGKETFVGVKPCYRLTWSGDILNTTVAEALADAMLLIPKMQFWCYTRTMDAVEPLCKASNCAVYVSADDVNQHIAVPLYNKLSAKYLNVHLAYMSEVKPDLDMIRCIAYNDGVESEGICSKCKICVYGRRNVWFPTRK